MWQTRPEGRRLLQDVLLGIRRPAAVPGERESVSCRCASSKLVARQVVDGWNRVQRRAGSCSVVLKSLWSSGCRLSEVRVRDGYCFASFPGLATRLKRATFPITVRAY